MGSDGAPSPALAAARVSDPARRPLRRPLPLLEIGDRRHPALGGQAVDQLRQDDGELAQHLLLGHAGALRQFLEHAAAEGAAELAGLDRLVLAGADPGIDLLAGAARRSACR